MAELAISKSDFVGVSTEDMWTSYSVLEELGRGAFGRVFKVSHALSGSVFALKSVPRMRVTDVAKLKIEFDLLRLLDHPQVVRIYNVFEDSQNVNIVMELCEGGELLKDYVALTELEAMKVMKQILNAVSYLHANNVCHRDLKPENVLFAMKGNIESLKIIDFGLAKLTSPFRGMQTRVGSPYYVSPDVLRGNYSIACDLWSAGVILYVMLSGRPPFFAKNRPELFASILRAEYSFEGEEWTRISPNAKDLITKLLIVDPTMRHTAQQALEHPWFSEDIPDVSLEQCLPKIIHFYHCKNLQRAALLAIASFCNEAEIHALKLKFQALDLSHSGKITVSELSQGLKNMSEDDVKLVVQSLDQDKNGVVSYTEFIAATLDQAVLLEDGRLMDAFISLDLSRSGRITAENLRLVLGKSSENFLDLADTKNLLSEADRNGDGVIDFDEFMALVRRQNSERFSAISIAFTARTDKNIIAFPRTMEQDFGLESLEPLFECSALYYTLVSPESDNQTTPSDNERMSLDCISSPSQSGESPHFGSVFTHEEDDILRHLALEFDFDWPRIARLIPNKTPAQVAKRWTSKLDPSIKKTRWSAEEDQRIVQLQQTYGNNWKLIAQNLPGRPPAAVKSRYYNSIRKRGDSAIEQPRSLDRSIRQMAFPFAPAATPAPLQCIDKAIRITSLRKQLAGMEVLMAKTKAEISKLQGKSQQICD